MSNDSGAGQEPRWKAVNTDEKACAQRWASCVCAGSSCPGSHGLASTCSCHMDRPATSLLFTAKSLWRTQTVGPCAGVQKDLLGLFVNNAKQSF